MKNLDLSIFRAYDIRGLVDSQLSEEFAYHLGKAFVTYLKAKRVVVGQDMRESSYAYKEALFSGLTEMGADVIDIGLCSTPMMNFAAGSLEIDGGIMVTASHNPSQYNGFKLMRAKALPMSKEMGIADIAKIMQQEAYATSNKRGEITIDETVIEEYIEKMASFARPSERKLKVIVDCANGMGALEAKVFERLSDSLEITLMYEQLDGSFPNHEANPLNVETLKDLQEKVKSEGADIGIAFDGDADRVGFVDEKAQVIDSSQITSLIAEEILKGNEGETVLYDLRLSNIVVDTINENGGLPKETRVGHSFIKQTMLETKAVFAGELSGHYYFKENFNTESSSLATIYFLNALWQKEKPLSELMLPYQKYFHSGEINREVDDKEAVLKMLKEKFADGELSVLDGVKVVYQNWWFSMRPSNTEDVIRLVVEANTKEMMEEKRDEILLLI